MDLGRTSLRGCKEWKDYGLAFSTTSDEACKMFDAFLTQLVAWREDKSMGGCEGIMEKLLAADPDMVMGRVLELAVTLNEVARFPRKDEDTVKKLDHVMRLAKKVETTDWEKLHVEAIKLFVDGCLGAACRKWERILNEFPQDMFALKVADDTHFYLGEPEARRDLTARVLPHWKPEWPLYEYIFGIYAFGLCQMREYASAEKVARRGLALQPNDAWCYHSLAHSYEMGGRQQEGIDCFNNYSHMWKPSEFIAAHLTWHTGLYNATLGRYDTALDIFDNQMMCYLKGSRCLFDVSDAVSLLMRLEMEGVKVGERWKDMQDILEEGMVPDMLGFYDSFYVMGLKRAGCGDKAQKMMDSIRSFVRDGEYDTAVSRRRVGIPLCEALLAYDNEEYATAVELMLPLRYNLNVISGSDAQRDLWSQFLIQSAIRSPRKDHGCLARQLVYEREHIVKESPWTTRAMAKVLAVHKLDG